MAGLSLKLLELVSGKQVMFMEAARAAASTILLTPIDDLLLSINPKTAKPDYIKVIARFVNQTVEVKLSNMGVL